MRPPLTLRRAALVVLAAGCAVDGTPTAPPAAAPDSSAAATPLPALALDGAPGPLPLYFQPPIAPERVEGPFDGTRAPVVEICRWSGSACAAPPVATYARTQGTGGRLLVVDAEARLYRVDWPDPLAPTGSVYRILVTLDGAELGRAYARVPSVGETAASLAAAGYAVIGNGMALPIRFRIEQHETSLGGAPTAPASTMIPDREYDPRGAAFSTASPLVPGAPLSLNTLLLAFTPTTTVAQANALLQQIGATIVGGIAGTAAEPGILTVRVPATTHAQTQQALATLRASARVQVAVQDAILQTTAVPRPNDGIPTDWTWELAPTGGNWGLELLRVPQLWNLNAAVCKALERAYPAGDCANARAHPFVAPTVVLDKGFGYAHLDVAYRANLSERLLDDHGVMTAGVIGATFDNGLGIDGVNPFARLVVQGRRPLPFAPGTAPVERATTSFGHWVQLHFELLRNPEAHGARAMNISLGYNWADLRVNSATNLEAQRIANGHGLLFAVMQGLLVARAGRPLPVVVVSAGNDSDSGYGQQDARYGSPWAAAALSLPAAQRQANVVVVEALTRSPASAGGATRWLASNDNGHLSAPGDAVRTTTKGGPREYVVANGTSIAAPHVTGLVGYLYALAPEFPSPTRAANPMLALLTANAVPVAGGARPRVDAFAAALGLDVATGTNRVRRMLLDVDDGTADGNRRRNDDGSDYLGEDADGDHGVGDGAIDMSDFRRWRDWLLQTEGVALNGTPQHPKKDLNGDRRVGTPAEENVYPRGDFNGDGKIDRTSKAPVPGFAAPVTDLEVLQREFVDPEKDRSTLPTLLNSADLEIDAGACMALDGITDVASYAPGAGPFHHMRNGVPAAARRLSTVASPPGGLPAEIDARGRYRTASGELVSLHAFVSRQLEPAEVRPGADARYAPPCPPPLYVTYTYRPPWGGQVYPHLTGPADGGGRFHILREPACGPQTRLGRADAAPFAYISHDTYNCTGGALHVTQQRGGTYRYYVYDAARAASLTSDSLGRSGMTVRVYRGTRLAAEFAVPPRPGTLWTVFEMSGETIVPVNTMRFEPTPANIEPGATAPAAAAARARRD